ncbi:unnamed protein product [Choristocarpus tenellus]
MKVREKDGMRVAVRCNEACGPDFCGPLLRIPFNATRSLVSKNTHNYPYTESGIVKAILHEMNEQATADVEVFEVEYLHTPLMDPPSRRLLSVNYESLVMVPVIEGIFRQEEAALADANLELMKADETFRFGEESFVKIFGPTNTMIAPVEEGEEASVEGAGVETDEIVHLTVRGHVISTRSSTLVQCRHSVLAERFGAKGFSLAKETVDVKGRHVIDCCPVAFSRVLDVLRIRAADQAQASLSHFYKTAMKVRCYVHVKEEEREDFVGVVDSLFPDCQDFILDCILYE